MEAKTLQTITNGEKRMDLEEITTFDQLYDLGYESKGFMCVLENNVEIHERILVYENKEEDKLAVFDEGNGYCCIVSYDKALNPELWDKTYEGIYYKRNPDTKEKRSNPENERIRIRLLFSAC